MNIKFNFYKFLSKNCKTIKILKSVKANRVKLRSFLRYKISYIYENLFLIFNVTIFFRFLEISLLKKLKQNTQRGNEKG